MSGENRLFGENTAAAAKSALDAVSDKLENTFEAISIGDPTPTSGGAPPSAPAAEPAKPVAEEKPAVEDKAPDPPAAEPEPAKAHTLGWDDEITLPDGSKAVVKNIVNGDRERQADYTLKTQQLALYERQVSQELQREKESIEQTKAHLGAQAKAIEETGGHVVKLLALSKSNPEFREEVAALLEAHGHSDVAAEARIDPTILEMRAKINKLEAEQSAREVAAKEQAELTQKEAVKSQFNDMVQKLITEKFKNADAREVRSLIASGEFTKLEDALRYSHDKGVKNVATEETSKLQGKIEEQTTTGSPVRESRSAPIIDKDKVDLKGMTLDDPRFDAIMEGVTSKGIKFG